jgi:hypothetical protein
MSGAVKALLKDAAEDFPSPPRSLRIRKFLMAHPSLDLDRWQEAVDELYDQRCPPVRHLIFDVTRLKRHPCCRRLPQPEKSPAQGGASPREETAHQRAVTNMDPDTAQEL